MTRKVLILLALSSSAYAAIHADTVWEIRATGAQTNGGGVRWLSLVNATYKWTASGAEPNEYYCELAAGGDPSLTEPHSVTTDGNYNLAANGTLGSLAVGEWAWGDNDTLGYNTLYVRLTANRDPDTWFNWGKPGYVSMVYGGGTDYSQQDAAQATASDVATDGAGTLLTTTTACFTAQMVWNGVYIVNGGTTEGWYQITAFTDVNRVTIDRSAGASKTNATVNVGGAWRFGGTKDTTFYTTGGLPLAGNRVYWKSGTYALGGSITGANGSYGSPIVYIGYTSARGDDCFGTNRPLMTQAFDKAFAIGSSTFFANMRIEGNKTNNGTACLTYGAASVLYNVKCSQTSTNKGSYVFYASSAAGSCKLIGCEALQSAVPDATFLSRGIYAGNDTMVACHASGGNYGFQLQDGATLVQCVAQDANDGYYSTAQYSAINCGAYHCRYGFGYNSTSSAPAWINCIADASITADFYNHNASACNGVTIANCHDGPTGYVNIRNWFANEPATDAGLNDPANDDWRVDALDTNVYERGTDLQTYTAIRTH